MENVSIGVIGAGTIGRGVACSFAMHGYNVVLMDISSKALEEAVDEIRKNLRFQSLFGSRQDDECDDVVLDRIKCTVKLEELKDADLVIENIPENRQQKTEMQKVLNGICKESSIVAVNTSCIPISEIAAFSDRPFNVIGIHFMNPVHLIKAAEVIRGFHTSEETLQSTVDIIRSLDKECIVVNDQAGFVSNRVSHLMMNEAAFTVYENVAEPEQVDDIFKKCYGHKMGPLETADLIGLDTVVNSLEVLYEYYQDSKFRCCPLLKKMVSAGLLGRKSKQGFYKY